MQNDNYETKSYKLGEGVDCIYITFGKLYRKNYAFFCLGVFILPRIIKIGWQKVNVLIAF